MKDVNKQKWTNSNNSWLIQPSLLGTENIYPSNTASHFIHLLQGLILPIETNKITPQTARFKHRQISMLAVNTNKTSIYTK